jgi:hypothetical protein
VAAIQVDIEIAASPLVVWADVARIASHVEWMTDAEAIAFTSSTTEGIGTTFDCTTKIGPVTLSSPGPKPSRSGGGWAARFGPT